MALPRLFQTVTIYDGSASPSVSASAAQMVIVDMGAAAADVTVTFPSAGVEGQALGVGVGSASSAYRILADGRVDGTAFPLQRAGDCALFTWDPDAPFGEDLGGWKLVAQYHVPSLSDALFNHLLTNAAEVTAETGQFIVCNGADAEIVLPAAGPDVLAGSYLAVKNYTAGAGTITFSGGTVDESSTYELTEQNQSVLLIYSGQADGDTWRTIAGFDGALNSIVVQNGTELAAYDDAALADGCQAAIGSLLDTADLVRSSTATADNITIWNTVSGVGRWIRRCLPNPTWLRQTDWAISPATGNDENVGTAASPLATDAERARRWGQWGIPANGTILQVLDSLPLDKSLRLAVTMPETPNAATLTRFVVKCSETQMATGSLTGYTPLVRTTGATSRNLITSAVNFTSHVNRKIRLTSGTGSGYYAWIQAGGAGTATITPWVQEVTSDTANPPSAAVLQPGGITAGDTFEILEAASIGAAPRLAFTAGGGTNAGNTGTSAVQLKNLRISQAFASANGIPSGYIESQGPGVALYMLGCDLGRVALNVALNRGQGCLVGGGILTGVSTIGNSVRFTGGGTRVDGSSGLSISGASTVTFDGDFAVTIPLIIGGGSTVLSCFPATCRFGNVFFAVTGDAVLVNGAAVLEIRNGDYGSHVVYGTASTYGFRIVSGGKVTYTTTKPTINATLGAGRETIIGGTDTQYGAVPFVNAANLAMLAVAA